MSWTEDARYTQTQNQAKMDGLLLPLKTTKSVKSNISKFENLSLNESSTSRPTSTKSKRSIVDLSSPVSESTEDTFDLKPSIISSQTSVSSRPSTSDKASYQKHRRYDSTAFLQKSYLNKSALATLPDDARVILRSQPEPEDLLAVLQYLDYGIRGKHHFNVHIASPQGSQIVAAIVTKIIAEYWHIVQQSQTSKIEAAIRTLLITVLRCVPGIGALLLQLKQLGPLAMEQKTLLHDTASVLGAVFKNSAVLQGLMQDTTKLYVKHSMHRAVWQEVVTLLAGSKILSTASESLQTVGKEEAPDLLFLLDGNEYVKWLAGNVSYAMTSLPISELESWTMLSQIAKRGLNIGYRESFVSELYLTLLLGSKALWTPLIQLLEAFSPPEQRSFFDAMLRDLTRKYLRSGVTVESLQLNGLESDSAIGGVAAIVSGMVGASKVLDEHLTIWLTSTSGDYATLGLDTRRAVIATLALRKGKIMLLVICSDADVLQKSFSKSSKSAWRTSGTSCRSSTARFFSKSVSFDQHCRSRRPCLRATHSIDRYDTTDPWLPSTTRFRHRQRSCTARYLPTNHLKPSCRDCSSSSTSWHDCCHGCLNTGGCTG